MNTKQIDEVATAAYRRKFLFRLIGFFVLLFAIGGIFGVMTHRWEREKKQKSDKPASINQPVKSNSSAGNQNRPKANVPPKDPAPLANKKK